MEPINLPASAKVRKILIKNQKRLEKELNLKLKIKKESIEIKGDALTEYVLKNIIDAFEDGFDLSSVLLLLKEDYVFESINMKDYVRPSRLNTIKGRVIGTKGKTKKVIQDLTECDMVVHDNTISLIGTAENIALASKAIKSLMRGSPHSAVYAFLEKNQKYLKGAEKIKTLEDLE